VTQITAAVHAGRYECAMNKSFLRPFIADWRRWSPAERIAAILLLAGIVLIQVPLIL
jgi:hypothetical protein